MIKKNLNPITYTLVVLLLFMSGLSLASAYPVSSELDDGTERILVCTSQGYKWITINTLNPESPTPVDSNSTNTHHDCPFCTFGFYAIDGAINNTLLSMLFTPRFSAIARHFLTHINTLTFYPSLHHLSRAPPTSA